MSAESETQSRQVGFEMFVSRVIGKDIFAGVTDRADRKDRVRKLLSWTGRATEVLDDLQGWETWACRFERIYGEPLVLEGKQFTFQNFMVDNAQLAQYAAHIQPQGEILGAGDDFDLVMAPAEDPL